METQGTHAAHPDGVKETMESIVIALILAFVFRAFVVEAFVIPTGSMAPTLYGAHGAIICQDCGIEFAYGVRDLSETRNTIPIRSDSRAICPNCNHPNTNLHISDEQYNAQKGDRILVLKWPFDIGRERLGPERWDVVVFKDPSDGETNFIKRLIGLPDEVLMIVDGDIYTVETARLSDRALAELDAIRHEKYEFRVGRRQGALRPTSREVLAELDRKMKISRKPQAAQRALWSLVYDHNYPPRKLDPGQPSWRPSDPANSGWDASERRVLYQDRGIRPDSLELAGKRIDASSSYNVHGGRAPPVSDVRIRFVLTPLSREGVVHVRLEKRRRVFWASVYMDGLVTLAESAEAPRRSHVTMAAKQLSPLTPGRPVQVSFENVDYRLKLSLDEREVLRSSNDRQLPAYYGPELRRLRRMAPTPTVPPQIYGEDGAFELSHLVVERDVYYYHDPSFRALNLSWAPSEGWGGPNYPILLRSNEYFMLGDNTSASKDSRLWDRVGRRLEVRGEDFQLGTVPHDQLIGKAFFVYWPYGHRIHWLPPIGHWNWAIIPDVGRMRWIR